MKNQDKEEIKLDDPKRSGEATSTYPSLKCKACLKVTYYLSDGFCLDCAYKKLMIDMSKRSPYYIPTPTVTTPIVPNYGVWTCPRCGMVLGPNTQTCWCSGNRVTCGTTVVFNPCVPALNHQVTQDMFKPYCERE